MRSDVCVGPKFCESTFWEELLAGWLELVKRYEQIDMEPDLSYWYNERPLTGLLAAAAWKRACGWSLEEFFCQEKGQTREVQGTY